MAKELVAPIKAPTARVRSQSTKLASACPGILHHDSLLISGLSYKIAFSNELLTSIFPL
jgi:hypothetical protein